MEHWKQLAQDRRRSEDLSSLMAKILLYVVSYVSCFFYFTYFSYSFQLFRLFLLFLL